MAENTFAYKILVKLLELLDTTISYHKKKDMKGDASENISKGLERDNCGKWFPFTQNKKPIEVVNVKILDVGPEE
jgi:hypothetical protein